MKVQRSIMQCADHKIEVCTSEWLSHYDHPNNENNRKDLKGTSSFDYI